MKTRPKKLKTFNWYAHHTEQLPKNHDLLRKSLKLQLCQPMKIMQLCKKEKGEDEKERDQALKSTVDDAAIGDSWWKTLEGSNSVTVLITQLF